MHIGAAAAGLIVLLVVGGFALVMLKTIATIVKALGY